MGSLAEPTAKGLHGRVLIIDDEPRVARICLRLCSALDLTGVAVHSLGEARAVLEDWQEEPFRFVIVDNRLADESGLDVLEELRELEPAPAIALVSAYLDSQVALAAFRLGAIPMAKPSSVGDLRQLLELLEASRQHQDSGTLPSSRDPSLRSSGVYASEPQTVELKPLVLRGRCLETPRGSYTLRRSEARILQYLMSLAGACASPRQLALAALQRNDDGAVHSIHSHITNLRVRLGRSACILRTIPDQGYCIDIEAIKSPTSSADS